jgi:hypothetical protein
MVSSHSFNNFRIALDWIGGSSTAHCGRSQLLGTACTAHCGRSQLLGTASTAYCDRS